MILPVRLRPTRNAPTAATTRVMLSTRSMICSDSGCDSAPPIRCPHRRDAKKDGVSGQNAAEVTAACRAASATRIPISACHRVPPAARTASTGR